MVLHLPRKRQRLPYHTRTTLTQGAEKAFHMSRQPHLLTSRRMPVRRNDGLVNRQQVGGHNRPLAILRRQRLPQTTRRELITLAGRHPHHLPRAAVQGRPYPPRLLFGTDETPQFIDFHPHLAGFFFKRAWLPGRLGIQRVDEALQPGSGDTDDADDGAQTEPFEEQTADEVVFFFGDGAFTWVGHEAMATAATAERRGADGVDAVADDRGDGT